MKIVISHLIFTIFCRVEAHVLTNLSLILLCVFAPFGFGQTSAPKYESGTITAVVPHQNAPSEPDNGVARYDVSVKIGSVVYVILYTPRNGANAVEYSPGISMLFSVGENALTFHSKLSGTIEAPILRREGVPPDGGLNLSNAPGEYFAMKLQHMSQVLDLSPEQQAEIKPTLEQETGEVSQFLRNPVLSRKNKMERYEQIVRSSDAKIKASLSQAQAEKLLQVRRQQKQDVKKFIAQHTSEKLD